VTFSGFFLALAMAWGSGLEARELAGFSCTRPAAVDEGTLFNVALACKLINGMVLEPGETFSYNDAMRTGVGMFKPGLTIKGGRFTQSIGGGYCQVTTALYNAVLMVGLPVRERYNHSLYDPQEAYVPPGRDAAVSRENNADFRFTNATPAPLTIVAQANGLQVDVSLLGHTRRKKRWLSQEILVRRPKKVQRIPDTQAGVGKEVLLQIGYDGLLVQTYAHFLDADGNTMTIAISKDRYIMVPEKRAFSPEDEKK
jgi:vancomycin resistance protein YoaR